MLGTHPREDKDVLDTSGLACFGAATCPFGVEAIPRWADDDVVHALAALGKGVLGIPVHRHAGHVVSADGWRDGGVGVKAAAQGAKELVAAGERDA
jgi:hypothetical protein